jgi:chaperone required for assembly of F1-ATPase
VARHAGSDLLCYRADGPETLSDRQAKLWGPWLDWAAEALGVALEPTVGITHRLQSPAALDRARALAFELDDFALTGLAAASTLFGSAVLAFALQRGVLKGMEAFDLSRLDEAFQAERWGVDAEAQARVDARAAEADFLGRWLEACDGAQG